MAYFQHVGVPFFNIVTLSFMHQRERDWKPFRLIDWVWLLIWTAKAVEPRLTWWNFFLYLYPHATPHHCQYESSPSIYSKWEQGIYARLRTNIVTLPITSPRSHPFKIFRAKRMFGVWVFYNSALISLQMENPTACQSIICFPLLAFKSSHNRYNYGHIICATGKKKPVSSYIWLHKLFTTAAFAAIALRQKWFILTLRDDALLILCLTESCISTTVKVTSLQLGSTWISPMKLAGSVFYSDLLGVFFTSLWYKSQICIEYQKRTISTAPHLSFGLFLDLDFSFRGAGLYQPHISFHFPRFSFNAFVTQNHGTGSWKKEVMEN